MKSSFIIIFLVLIQTHLFAQNFEWAHKKTHSSNVIFGTDVTCDSSGNAYNLWTSTKHGLYSAISGVNSNGVEFFTKKFISYHNGFLNNLECVHDSLYAAVNLFKRFQFDSVRLLSFGYYDVAGVKMNLNATCLVGKHGGSYSNSIESSAAFLPDRFNNMYMLGTYYGTANFNGDTLISKGLSDVVLAKYKPDKSVFYLKSLGGTGKDSAVCMSVNPNSGIVVCGNFENDFFVDNDTLHATGLHDIFVTKFNSYGQLLWAKSMGSALEDKISKCDFDTAGNIYLTGTFNNGFTIDSITLNSSGGTDIFIVKLSKGGKVIWAKSFGTSHNDVVNDLKVSNKQFVYVGGSFTDTLVIDTMHRISKNNFDLYVIKLNRAGTVKWIVRAGSDDTVNVNKNCYLTGLAPDLFGNIYVSGSFSKQSRFGGISLINYGQNQSFLAKINDSFKVIANANSYCEGDSITISLVSPTSFAPNNFFVVELSNEAGIFTNSIILDTIYSSSSNFQFTVALADIINSSSNYQIRIRSSNPDLTAVSDNFKIYARANTITGAAKICTDQQVLLHAGNKNETSFQWLLNGTIIPGATDSFYYTPANQSGIYNYVITNFCFTDTSADFNLPYVAATLPTFNIPFDTITVNCPDTLNLNSYVNPNGGIFSGYYVHDTLYIPLTTDNSLRFIYYTHTDSLGCTYKLTDSIQLYVDDYLQLNGIPPGPICHTNPPFLITPTYTGGAITSNCGSCLQGFTFHPLLAPLSQSVLITYTVLGIYGCVEHAYLYFWVDVCTGIEQSDTGQLSYVYHQNNNSIEILNINEQKMIAKLFSIEGKLLLTQSLISASESAQINLNSHFPNGIYLLTIEGRNTVYNFKVIVNR